MEWVGRKVYECGFWKAGKERQVELEVLDTVKGGEVMDGMIEDNNGNNGPGKASSSAGSDLVRCWVCITCCSVNLVGTIKGFNWANSTCEWCVEGKLSEKLTLWKEQDCVECEEEIRQMGRQWVDNAMDVDEAHADDVSEESKDDENDSEVIKELKVRFFTGIV